jgi:hypothetical protein
MGSLESMTTLPTGAVGSVIELAKSQQRSTHQNKLVISSSATSHTIVTLENRSDLVASTHLSRGGLQGSRDFPVIPAYDDAQGESA